MTHDCAHQGHIWIGTDGQPFQRHRDRPRGLVAVACIHCKATAQLEAHGAFTPPPGEHEVDHTIPPQLKKVLARAVRVAKKAEKAKQPNPGPADMS